MTPLIWVFASQGLVLPSLVPFRMLIGLGIKMIVKALVALPSFLIAILSHGVHGSNLQSLDQVHVRLSKVLVLRDRLGRHLVGLNVRKTTTLRGLGLARLTRVLVRRTRHRWSRRRGTSR
jgi:hypothetical protein